MNSKNKVFLKDDSTSALSNFMAFSSINLLRLVCTVANYPGGNRGHSLCQIDRACV
jgi:hypothetical protein